MAGHDDRLIDSLYEAAVDPARYDALMDAWGTLLEQELAQYPDKQPELPVRLVRHFEYAGEILERMSAVRAVPGETCQDIERDNGPSFLVSAEGRILAGNRTATDAFGELTGQDISELLLEPRMLGGLRRSLRTPPGPQRGVRLAGLAWDRQGETQYLLFFCPNPSVMTSKAVGKLVAAGLNWIESTASHLEQLYGLTPAEIAIARGWVEGHTLGELAEAKERSLQTLRTQAKSLLRKTGQRSQLDLVRLVAGIVLATGSNTDSARIEDDGDMLQFELPDGRVMHVEFAGPITGEPMVLMHGMLSGTGLSEEARRALEQRQIRLILPWRGSYALSSPYVGKPSAMPERHARDVALLLDHLGHERVLMCGQASGFMHAATFAGLFPHRITQLVGIAAGIPIATQKQLRQMPSRQRFVAYTARHLPSVLPVIVKAGIAQIATNGIDAFIDALYPAGTVDGAVSRRPEIRDIMRKAYRETTRQGHCGFETEMWHAVRDWSSILRAASVDFTLLHGTRDDVVQIGDVEALCARLACARLVAVRDKGQLMLHDDPALVFGIIQALAHGRSMPDMITPGDADWKGSMRAGPAGFAGEPRAAHRL
ncbi:alpha/beta fold hydrolase [Zhengella sp. ZM62]|uniref:alpha/beta fold hydrolase n=1 Tax=Zhengella sedimenti TaxID=3390035 RepID=UPI00397540F4